MRSLLLCICSPPPHLSALFLLSTILAPLLRLSSYIQLSMMHYQFIIREINSSHEDITSATRTTCQATGHGFLSSSSYIIAHRSFMTYWNPSIAPTTSTNLVSHLSFSWIWLSVYFLCLKGIRYPFQFSLDAREPLWGALCFSCCS